MINRSNLKTRQRADLKHLYGTRGIWGGDKPFTMTPGLVYLKLQEMCEIVVKVPEISIIRNYSIRPTNDDKTDFLVSVTFLMDHAQLFSPKIYASVFQNSCRIDRDCGTTTTRLLILRNKSLNFYLINLFRNLNSFPLLTRPCLLRFFYFISKN